MNTTGHLDYVKGYGGLTSWAHRVWQPTRRRRAVLLWDNAAHFASGRGFVVKYDRQTNIQSENRRSRGCMSKLSVREKIVTAAVDHLHAVGYHACSVQEIVDAAAVPKGSLTFKRALRGIRRHR